MPAASYTKGGLVGHWNWALDQYRDNGSHNKSSILYVVVVVYCRLWCKHRMHEIFLERSMMTNATLCRQAAVMLGDINFWNSVLSRFYLWIKSIYLVGLLVGLGVGVGLGLGLGVECWKICVGCLTLLFLTFFSCLGPFLLAKDVTKLGVSDAGATGLKKFSSAGLLITSSKSSSKSLASSKSLFKSCKRPSLPCPWGRTPPNDLLSCKDQIYSAYAS